MSRVLLVGPGSIGTVYLYILQQAGASISAVCRSNYAVVKENGITLNSAKFGQSLKVRPTVYSSIQTPSEPYDYVLITTKCFPGTSQPALIAPVVGHSTTIVLMQNGIGIEKEYAEAYPSNPLLSCVVYQITKTTSPGVVSMDNLENVKIGAYPASASRAPADALAKLLKAGGGQPVVLDDVQSRRFAKLLVNAPWNPICALTRSWTSDFIASSEGAVDLFYNVMLEVVAIAQAYGYTDVTQADADRQLEIAKTSSGMQPSMLGDVLGDRPVEVEAIMGNLVRLGKAKQADVTRLEMLYVLLKAYDVGAEKRRNAGGKLWD